MINSEQQTWDIVEFTCGCNATDITASGDGDMWWSQEAGGSSTYINNATIIDPGFTLLAKSSHDPVADFWEVGFILPELGIAFSDSGTDLKTAVEISVRFHDVPLWGLGPGTFSTMKLEFSKISISYNGNSWIDIASGSDFISGGKGPSYIPLIGLGYETSISCSAGKVNLPDTDCNYCDPGSVKYNYAVNILSSYDGGMRMYKDGEWVTFRITPKLIPVQGACSAGVSGLPGNFESYGSLYNARFSESRDYSYVGNTGLDTKWVNACIDDETGEVLSSISGPAVCTDRCTLEPVGDYAMVYQEKAHIEEERYSITLIPDLQKYFVPCNRYTKYKALLRRNEFPQVNGTGTMFCRFTDFTISDDNVVAVYPRLSEFEGVGGYELISETLRTTYAPTTAVVKKQDLLYWHTCGAASCFSHNESSFTCPIGSSKTMYVDKGELYLEDEITVSEYTSVFPSSVSFSGSAVNTQQHALPLPSYIGTWVHPFWSWGLAYKNWAVNGETLDSKTLYWERVRQQLSGGVRFTNYMSHVGPIGDTVWQDTFFGGYRYIGCSDFKIIGNVLKRQPVQLSESSPGEWSYDSGELTISFSDKIYVVGTGKLELLLQSFDTAPYSACMFMTQLDTEVVPKNNCRVYTKTKTDQLNEILAFPHKFKRVSSTKYAGTWSTDRGAGYVDDDGIDLAPNGVSDTINTTFTLGLGTDGSYKSIVFDITDNCVISWPSFTVTEDIRPVLESGIYLDMLLNKQHAVRWGDSNFYDGDNYWNPPLPNVVGDYNSAIDGMGYYLTLTGESSDASTVVSRLSTFYKPFEASSLHEFYRDSLSFILVPDNNSAAYMCISNSYTMPPLALFPTRFIDVKTMTRVSDYCQAIYDWSQEEKFLVSPVANTLTYTSGTFNTSWPGWYLWEYSTTNRDDWDKVKSEVAKVHNWTGYVFSGIPRTEVIGIIDTAVTFLGEIETIILDSSGELTKHFEQRPTETVATDVKWATIVQQKESIVVSALSNSGELANYWGDYLQKELVPLPMTIKNFRTAVTPFGELHYILQDIDNNLWSKVEDNLPVPLNIGIDENAYDLVYLEGVGVLSTLVSGEIKRYFYYGGSFVPEA